MTVRSIALTLAALATASTVSAEDADWYRGGWRADTDAPEVYQFDGTTLAPLEGNFDKDKGIAFTIRTSTSTARSPRPTARGTAEPAGWRLLWCEVHPNLLDVYLARTFSGMPYLIGSSPVTIGDDDPRHLQGGTGERRLNALERSELFFADRDRVHDRLPARTCRLARPGPWTS